MYYTMADAKRDFGRGYLKSFGIERYTLQMGWAVYLMDGEAVGYLVDARTKKDRLFKTLDAAVSAVESIGFKVDRLIPS